MTVSQWEHHAAPNQIASPKTGLTLHAHAGWRRSPGEIGDRVVLIADGTGIQRPAMGRFPLDMALPPTNGKAGPQTGPRELGEPVLPKLRAGNKGSRSELKSATETRIDGPPALPVHLAGRIEGGAQCERIVAGTQGRSKRLWASSKALAHCSFGRARPACEQAIGSVGLTGP